MKKKRMFFCALLAVTGAVTVPSAFAYAQETEEVSYGEEEWDTETDAELLEAISGLDYDAVVATGYFDRYVVLAKRGFSTEYGMYDTKEKAWLVDYMELPGISGENTDEEGYLDLEYYGAGTFFYACCYTENGYSDDIGFLSGDAGGYFVEEGLEPIVIYSTEFDEESRKLMLVTRDENERTDVLILDTLGNRSDLETYGVEADAFEGYKLSAYMPQADALVFQKDAQETKAVFYDPGKDRMNCYDNGTDIVQILADRSPYSWNISTLYDSEGEFYMAASMLRGDDGEYYSMIFDREGAAVVPAFQIPSEEETELQENALDEALFGTWLWMADEETNTVAAFTFEKEHKLSFTANDESGEVMYYASEEEHTLQVVADDEVYTYFYYAADEKMFMADGEEDLIVLTRTGDAAE